MAAMMKLSLWFQFLFFLLGEAPSPGFSMMEQERESLEGHVSR